jgi:hypothetical protein
MKVNLDKINASAHGNIESVVADVALENGALISLGERVDGERELMNAVAPAADAEVLLVAAPEMKYEENVDRLDMATPAGEPARAYHLVKGDIFRVEVELFDAEPAKGDIVTASADYGYTATGADTAATRFQVELVGPYLGTRMVRLRVL